MNQHHTTGIDRQLAVVVLALILFLTVLPYWLLAILAACALSGKVLYRHHQRVAATNDDPIRGVVIGEDRAVGRSWSAIDSSQRTD